MWYLRQQTGTEEDLKDTTLADFPIDMGAEWIHSNPAVLDLLRTPDRDQDELISYHLEVGDLGRTALSRCPSPS